MASSTVAEFLALIVLAKILVGPGTVDIVTDSKVMLTAFRSYQLTGAVKRLVSQGLLMQGVDAPASTRHELEMDEGAQVCLSSEGAE